MRIEEVKCIYDPGCHCAFTDIIRWRGRVYVAFREAVNHSVHLSGQVVVLGSADFGRSFQAHARLAWPGHDLRDPHFFTVGDRLGLAMPSWLVPDPSRGAPERVRTCHVALSPDAMSWETRMPEELQGKSLWRPRTGPDGQLYAAGYAASREEADYRVALYRSGDGARWEMVSPIHNEDRANETDICFMPDGELLALVRCEEMPKRPVLARSKPPYATWEKVRCSRFLQGPLLVRLPDGTLLAVGRSPEPMDSERPAGCVTRGFRLDPETGALKHLFTLPSGGDTSYAGLCLLDQTQALLSYYSGHGHPNGTYRAGDETQRCAIYMARVALS